MTKREELDRILLASPTMRLVPLAGHMVSQRFGRMFGEQDGLTASSAAVLSALGRREVPGCAPGTPGRATHADLARRCMIAPATVTGVVNTLVKAGYLRRERDAEDRRVVWLVITEAGSARVADFRSQLRAFAAPVMADVDAEQEAVIRDFLIKVISRYAVLDEPADGEPINTASINTAPINTAPIHAGPINTEPIDTEPINAEQINAEPINAEPPDRPAAAA